MSPTIEFLLQFARTLAALALLPVALFLALAIVGVGNVTTDASPAQLYLSAGIYFGFTLACVVYGIRGARPWLAWMLIAAGALPQALMLFSVG